MEEPFHRWASRSFLGGLRQNRKKGGSKLENDGKVTWTKVEYAQRLAQLPSGRDEFHKRTRKGSDRLAPTRKRKNREI